MSNGMSELEANGISSEIESIEADLSELHEVFGDIGLELGGDGDTESDQATSNELEDLNTEIKNTEFDVLVTESIGDLTVLQIADGFFPVESMQEGWLSNLNPGKIIKDVVKGKAGKIIKKIVKLVKKYKKLASCIPTVTVAVAAFKAGKYGTALSSGYSAYKCIKAKI